MHCHMCDSPLIGLSKGYHDALISRLVRANLRINEGRQCFEAWAARLSLERTASCAGPPQPEIVIIHNLNHMHAVESLSVSCRQELRDCSRHVWGIMCIMAATMAGTSRPCCGLCDATGLLAPPLFTADIQSSAASLAAGL